MWSAVLSFITCFSIINDLDASDSGICCCGCPITPCPLKLSKTCTSEPRTPCSYFEESSRYLVSCIEFLDVEREQELKRLRRQVPIGGGNTLQTTTPYEFIPIPRASQTTPSPRRASWSPSTQRQPPAASRGAPAKQLQQFQGEPLIKPGIGYGLNGPMAFPNRLAWSLSGLINGIANNVHNFVDSFQWIAGGLRGG